MANATRDIQTDQNGTPDVVLPQLLSFPVAASTLLYAGTFAATNAAGNLVATMTNAVKIWGRIERQVDNSSGAAGDLNAEIHAGFFYLNNDSTNAVTNAYRGQPCYAVDNNTVGFSSVGGSLPFAGYVVDVPASGSVEYGKVCVAVGMGNPYILNPELAATLAANFVARGVATNLEALTFTAGSFEMNANGALATQDGLTIAVGDILIFPAGVLTTGTVSAANSGPYEITAIGAVGAKVAGRRPAWWPHAGYIPAQPIRVRSGTLFAASSWEPSAAATAVIGTDDPALYPAKVTQTVTLSSSAATIINVPIRSATKSNVVASLSAVGGTTTNTIGWGIIVAPTAGGIGTASTVVNAIASGGTKNGTADQSVLLVSIFN